MTEIIGSSILILGYGAEGHSVHRWLSKNYPHVKIAIADQHQVKPSGSLRNVRLLRSFANFSKFNTIIRSPGIPIGLPVLQKAAAAGSHITSATNIFFSVCPGKIIGITGTKGKSTTAVLIAKILMQKYLDVRLVGNIGRPALDYVSGADRNTIFVMEISSFQLEDIRYSPQIAVILDVFPEHLDRYRNFKDYVGAKSRIVRFQTAKNYVVFNPDRKIPAQIASESLANKCLTFADMQMSDFCRRIPLLGEGNRENCAAAVAVAKILAVPYPAIRRAVKNFKPLPHRLEKVGEFHGVTFYNDSISTIPESTIHGLNALGEKVETLIAGGFDRGLDYSSLGKFLANRRGLKNIILFPDTGEKIWQAVLAAVKRQKSPLHLKKFPVSSMKQAVKVAFGQTSAGKICLLSPAAASYNLFKNFEERGNEFKKQIY